MLILKDIRNLVMQNARISFSNEKSYPLDPESGFVPKSDQCWVRLLEWDGRGFIAIHYIDPFLRFDKLTGIYSEEETSDVWPFSPDL